MKQVLQSMRDGKTVVTDVPAPQARPGMALVRTGASLVSAGTERMVVEFAEKSLVDKARSRPDLVRQMIDKARREGIFRPWKRPSTGWTNRWPWDIPLPGRSSR